MVVVANPGWITENSQPLQYNLARVLDTNSLLRIALGLAATLLYTMSSPYDVRVITPLYTLACYMTTEVKRLATHCPLYIPVCIKV